MKQLDTNCVTADAQKFIEIFLPFCHLKRGKAFRQAAWRIVDNNGNGYVSLAETGKWIQNQCIHSLLDEAKLCDKGKSGKTGKGHLGKKKVKKAQEEGTRLYKLFYPCYIRAFLDAADIGKNGAVRGTKSATKDDYVQKNEFRYLCVYICIYALMYDAFAIVDGGSAGRTKDDDRRISKAELASACSKFKGHPLVGVGLLGMPDSYGTIDTIFGEMDADGKGKVLLNEWCGWLEDQEQKNKTKLGRLLTFSRDGADE